MQTQGVYSATPIHECSHSSKLPNIKKGLILTPNLITKLGKIDFLFGSSAYKKSADNRRICSARINQDIKPPSPFSQNNKEIVPNSTLNVENRKNSVIFDNIYFDKSMKFYKKKKLMNFFFLSLSVKFIEE